MDMIFTDPQSMLQDGRARHAELIREAEFRRITRGSHERLLLCDLLIGLGKKLIHIGQTIEDQRHRTAHAAQYVP